MWLSNRGLLTVGTSGRLSRTKDAASSGLLKLSIVTRFDGPVTCWWPVSSDRMPPSPRTRPLFGATKKESVFRLRGVLGSLTGDAGALSTGSAPLIMGSKPPWLRGANGRGVTWSVTGDGGALLSCSPQKPPAESGATRPGRLVVIEGRGVGWLVGLDRCGAGWLVALDRCGAGCVGASMNVDRAECRCSAGVTRAE